MNESRKDDAALAGPTEGLLGSLEQTIDRRRQEEARITGAELAGDGGIAFLVTDHMRPEGQADGDAELIVRQWRTERVGLPEG